MKKMHTRIVSNAAVLWIILMPLLAFHTGSFATAGGLPFSVNPCAPAFDISRPGAQGFPVRIHGQFHQPASPERGCGPMECQPRKTRASQGTVFGTGVSGIVPLKVLDPGPIRPIITGTAALAGALVAAPFRLIETVFPPEEPRNLSCAPATLPPASRQQSNSCPNQVPPAVVAENRYPPMEPQSLLMGIVRFPFTLLEQGRFQGDIGNTQE